MANEREAGKEGTATKTAGSAGKEADKADAPKTAGPKAVPVPSVPPAAGAVSLPAMGGSLYEGLAMGELVVRLDTYDDIFSDFDPRPLARRELSDDLLKELGRRYRENPKGDLEVRFYIPAAAREPRLEGVIRKRLKEHFAQDRQKIRAQIRAHRQKGVHYAAVGFVLLAGELLLTLSQPDAVWAKVVGIVLTPAGWFSLWTGMEKVLEVPYAMSQQQDFHDRFSKCNYIFMTEDRE